MKVAVIEVKRTGEGDPLEFAVIVRVGDGETRHHVTMVRDTCERLTAGTHTPERCIEAAFEFLLECLQPDAEIVGGEIPSRPLPLSLVTRRRAAGATPGSSG